MSLAAMVADMLSIPELTHPVTLGGAGTRGIVDEQGSMIPIAGTEGQRIGRTLYVQKDAVPGIAQGATVVVGALGAASAADGRTYLLGPVEPIDDGLLLACQLGGGRP
ncbi:MAG: hypothetical protein KF709_02635 [Gemmatimonadaceae bacterium]|nr:hypothetical protein [Gemmatimonadaceae bacterium]